MQTSDGGLRTLQLRTSGLERRLRAQRWQFAAAMLVILSVVWLLLAASSATVEAETFVLNDASGVRRAEMSMVLDQPTVTLYDANGQIRGAFRLGADGQPEYIDAFRESM
ncbi:MAG: hypothetical protein IH849_09375 [Acidobacteria bacterium]|nr:hypothetical protein [Acidobacteriota bacterium]